MNGFSKAVSAIVMGCILFGFVGGAVAQPFSPYRHYSSSLFVNGNLKLFFQKQWRARVLASSGASMEGPTAPQVQLPLSVSSFRTVSAPIMPKRLAAGVPDLDEAQRQELENSFLEMLKGYEQLLDTRDESQLRNSLAGAFNYLFMSSYYVLKNGQELTEEQRESMLEQINTGIGLGLKERRMSDRDKQELYEAVVLSGSLILGLYNEGRDKGRPEQMKTARELARDLLEQMMGITLDKVHVNGGSVRVE